MFRTVSPGGRWASAGEWQERSQVRGEGTGRPAADGRPVRQASSRVAAAGPGGRMPAGRGRPGGWAEGQVVAAVFELCANCDLRTALTQCGLSHQEVPMPQTPRRARAAGWVPGRGPGAGGPRERIQGGR